MKKILRRIINVFKDKNYIPIPNLVYSDKLLKGKIALITGGSSGIGYAIAKEFLKNGCKVIITGTKEEKLKMCCEKLQGNVKYIVLNVLDVENIHQKVNLASSLFEENRIDILVNSAGVFSKNNFYNMTIEEYNLVMNTNIRGTYFMSQVVAKMMIEKKIKGHILNISSSSSQRPAWTPYQLSKWAIKGFTKGLADLLVQYGIVVNAIAPGPTATPMLNKYDSNNIYYNDTPVKRFVMPIEIANMAVVLVSDMGNLVIGDTVYVTGGSGVITLHH